MAATFGTPTDSQQFNGSVTSAAVLATVDCTGFNSISVEITANASSNALTFETSDDEVTWFSTSGLVASAGSGNGSITTTTATSALYTFPVRGQWFRCRVSTFVAGTITVVGSLHVAPWPALSGATTIGAGTQLLGQFGYSIPLSTQTPYAIGATGTTGAVTATGSKASGKTSYICGFDVSALGGTATIGPVTITGLIGSTTFTYYIASTASGNFLSKTFDPPLPASATNTSIVITTTADGTASNVAVNIYGFYQ